MLCFYASRDVFGICVSVSCQQGHVVGPGHAGHGIFEVYGALMKIELLQHPESCMALSIVCVCVCVRVSVVFT